MPWTRLALLALVAVAASVPTAAQAGANACTPAGSKTLAKNRHARIFKLKGKFYGCRFATNHAYQLWVRKHTVRVENIRIAGSFVAYSYYAEPSSCDWWRVGVRSIDLRDGSHARRIHSLGCGDTIRYKITDLAMRGNGSFGVIRYTEDLEDGKETSSYSIIKADAPSEQILDTQGLGEYNEDGSEFIDNPDAIVPGGLSYSGGKLIWQRARGSMSAPLN